MTRFVLTPDAALRLLAGGRDPVEAHRLVAPTLLRSQLLSALYAEVRDGALDRKTAAARLDRFRALPFRLLGDRVLQRKAWEVAERLDWPDTELAEYVALTGLQADALITLDADLARQVKGLVPLAPFEVLFDA